MIVVCGTAKIRPGALASASSKEAMKAMIEASRREEGCLYYAYGADVLAPDTIIALEYWKDWAALDAHFKTPHMAVWRKFLGEIGVVERDLKGIEAKEVRVI